MENYVTAQLAALCKAVLLGWLSGCVYDLLRSVRLLRRHSPRADAHARRALRRCAAAGAAGLCAACGRRAAAALHAAGRGGGVRALFLGVPGNFPAALGLLDGRGRVDGRAAGKACPFCAENGKKNRPLPEKTLPFSAQMRYNETVSVEVSPHATQQRRREGEKCPCKRKRRPASAVILPAFWSF